MNHANGNYNSHQIVIILKNNTQSWMVNRIARVLHLYWFDCVAKVFFSFWFEHLQGKGCHSLCTYLVPLFHNPYKQHIIFFYIEFELPVFQAVLAASHNKKLAISSLCVLIPQQQENLTLLKSKKPRFFIHMRQPWPSWWTPLKSLLYVSVCPVPEPCTAWVISPARNTRAVSVPHLGAVQVHPKIQGTFAAQVHFFLGRDCCFPGTCCLSVPFLHSCFCSVSPSLSCCRGEYFPGLWEIL